MGRPANEGIQIFLLEHKGDADPLESDLFERRQDIVDHVSVHDSLFVVGHRLLVQLHPGFRTHEF